MRRNWGEPEREAAGQYARCQCRQRPLSLARPDELVNGPGAARGRSAGGTRGGAGGGRRWYSS